MGSGGTERYGLQLQPRHRHHHHHQCCCRRGHLQHLSIGVRAPRRQARTPTRSSSCRAEMDMMIVTVSTPRAALWVAPQTPKAHNTKARDRYMYVIRYGIDKSRPQTLRRDPRRYEDLTRRPRPADTHTLHSRMHLHASCIRLRKKLRLRSHMLPLLPFSGGGGGPSSGATPHAHTITMPKCHRSETTPSHVLEHSPASPRRDLCVPSMSLSIAGRHLASPHALRGGWRRGRP